MLRLAFGPVRKAILGLSTTLENNEKVARQKAMDEAMDLVSGWGPAALF